MTRTARHVLAAVAAATTAVLGVTGSALAGTPSALPTGTILNAGRPGAVRNSYLVTVDPGRRVTAVSQRLLRRYGGTVVTDYTSALTGFAATMTETQAERLAADPAVRSVEQNAVVRADSVQADPPWNLDRIDQRRLPLSGTYTSGSAAGVTVYVLDTGVNVAHSEFGGRARNGWDFVDNDRIAQDCNGHGTHVAGTVGGATYGVAKDVTIVAVRVLGCNGSASYSTILKGIDWVTRQAKATGAPAVATMSLGGPASRTLDTAVKNSIRAGVAYTIAAGNDGTDACTQSPARLPEAITVGATDATDRRASFSNFGRCLDLFAPGVRIVSAKARSTSGSTVMSGTSMATPAVAGAVALLLGAHPGWTPVQIRTALIAASTKSVVIGAGKGSPNQLLYTGP